MATEIPFSIADTIARIDAGDLAPLRTIEVRQELEALSHTLTAPALNAIITECDSKEERRRRYLDAYACAGCDFKPESAVRLFVHLLTCTQYARLVSSTEWPPV